SFDVFYLFICLPPCSTLFPYTTLFRSLFLIALIGLGTLAYCNSFDVPFVFDDLATIQKNTDVRFGEFKWSIYARSVQYLTYTLKDRKSTRLNSSHLGISYAVFCLKKKN